MQFPGCVNRARSFTAWLSTGNNGAYAALAAVAVVVVFGMMAKR